MRSIPGALLFGWLAASVADAQTTQRVSVSSSGVPANADAELWGLSADARYAVFGSAADNLVGGDTNGVYDVFVRDLQLGETVRASVDSAGAQANASCVYPALSADGRHVVFQSHATNLVAGDTNGWLDVFVRDLDTGVTARVSVDSNGVQANNESWRATLSADGRYVAFASFATNLVGADTNGRLDVFVHDRQTGVTSRESLSSTGVQGNGDSNYPVISADGRYVAFMSFASNLVVGDTNGAFDVFRRDIQTGETIRVSVSSIGAEGNGASPASASQVVSISPEGRYVAFDSSASNLVAGDTNGTDDVFVRDVQTSQTVRVSIDSAGIQGNGFSRMPALSGNGRYVAFQSAATNLVVSDTNGFSDIFVHDLQTGQTSRESVDTTGAQGNGNSVGRRLSLDGRYLAFSTQATNYVVGDTDGSFDVFLRDRLGVGRALAFCFGDGSLATPCPCAPPNTVPNPSGAPGHGCANSFDLDGGQLTVAGVLAPDQAAFTAEIGPSYLGFGFLVKGNAQNASGIANGDGVRCVDGALIRFGGHNAGTNGAAAGSWTYPNAVQTAPVTVATAQAAGQSAWYQLFYRNATASFCSSGTTNWTNGIRISWPP